jgi:hypothetical protein
VAHEEAAQALRAISERATSRRRATSDAEFLRDTFAGESAVRSVSRGVPARDRGCLRSA